MLSALFLWLACCPFEQPLLGDRAYLAYMAQTVSRGEPLYQSTTFGYTPLAPLLGGGAIAAVQALWPEVSSVSVLRWLGLLGYLAWVLSAYQLGQRVFIHSWQTYTLVFSVLSMGFVTLLATLNLEPKLLAVPLQLWAVLFALNQRWFWAGMLASLALLTWQPMALVGLVLGLFVLSQRQWKPLIPMALGALVGLIPLVGYLHVTEGWEAFVENTWVRKTQQEAAQLGERPWAWLVWGVYPYFVTEIHLFLMSVLGLVFFAIHQGKRGLAAAKRMLGKREHRLLGMLSGAWMVFNSLEFQSSPDLLPLLPLLLISSVYALHRLRQGYPNPRIWWAFGLFLGFISLADLIVYRPTLTYAKEKALFAKMEAQYGDPFVINFEAYYVVQERPLPTRYMRFAPHEDFFIHRQPYGCEGILTQLQQEPPTAILFAEPLVLDGWEESCGNALLNAFIDQEVYQKIDLNTTGWMELPLPSPSTSLRLYPVSVPLASE